MEKIFRALAEKNRLRILLLLESGPLNVTEIVSILGLSQSNVSHHLKLLLDAEIVERRGRGNWAFYQSCRNNPFVSSVVKSAFEHKRLLAGFSEDMNRLATCYSARRTASTSFFNSLEEGDWKSISNGLNSVDEYLPFILEKISEESSVLEIGCGDGSMLPLLLGKAHKVIAVDNSIEMLNRAQKSLLNFNVDKAFLRLGDAEHLPLGDATVNFVLMHMLLHHAGNPSMAVQEAYRVLSDGGVLVLIDLLEHDNREFKEVQGDLWSGFSIKQITKYLTDAKFVINDKQLFIDSKVLGFVALKGDK